MVRQYGFETAFDMVNFLLKFVDKRQLTGVIVAQRWKGGNSKVLVVLKYEECNLKLDVKSDSIKLLNETSWMIMFIHKLDDIRRDLKIFRFDLLLTGFNYH